MNICRLIDLMPIMFDGGGSNAQLFVRFAAEVIAEVIAELMAELIRLSSRSGRISRLEKAPHCKSATNPAQSIPADSAFSSAPPPSLPPDDIGTIKHL